MWVRLREWLFKRRLPPVTASPKWRDHFTQYELAVWDHMLSENAKKPFVGLPDTGFRTPDIAERRRLIWDEVREFSMACERVRKIHPWMVDEGWQLDNSGEGKC